MIERIIDIAGVSALGLAGWVFLQLSKVESLEDKVDHIRSRVDALYQHFLDRHE